MGGVGGTREIFGTTCLSSSSCFPTTSGDIMDSPVMFPPGRATVATNPAATGSLTDDFAGVQPHADLDDGRV
jgi:hypothetical protein